MQHVCTVTRARAKEIMACHLFLSDCNNEGTPGFRWLKRAVRFVIARGTNSKVLQERPADTIHYEFSTLHFFLRVTCHAILWHFSKCDWIFLVERFTIDVRVLETYSISNKFAKGKLNVNYLKIFGFWIMLCVWLSRPSCTKNDKSDCSTAFSLFTME